MFFRFISAIILVVLVSMGGVLLEKKMLNLRRDVSKQRYRTEVLLDRYTALRLKTQELSSPDRMLETIQQHRLEPRPLTRPKNDDAQTSVDPVPNAGKPALPLLKWERPARPFRWRQKDVR